MITGEAMSNGIKLDKALIGGSVVSIEEISENIDGLKCPSCHAKIDYVSGYYTRNDDKKLRRFVNPYLRLEKGQKHSSNCQFTASGQIKIIVNSSTDVEKENNPLVERDTGDFIFRLNIPSKHMSKMKRKGEKYNAKKFKERKARIWSGKSIAPYCKSATGLARLWELLEDSDERTYLEDRIEFRLNDQSISWRDLYYPFPRLGKLSTLLANKSLKHPVAVLICIKNVITEKGRNWVQCTPYHDKRYQERTYIGPSINGSQTLLKQFKPGQHYIVFGEWYYTGSKDCEYENDDGEITFQATYKNINVQVHQKAQFCLVEMPDGE